MNQAYLDYLVKTLGVKDLLWPFSTEPQSAAETEPLKSELAAVSILFIADKAWGAPARQLFEKMRQAMKISDNRVKIIFSTELTQPDLQIQALSAERVVCFTEKLYQQISVDPALKYQIHDPELLLRQPALKKETWVELQKVMKSLNLS